MNYKKDAQEDLRNVALGFQESRVLLSAYELGVFSALAKTRKTAKQIGKVIKTDAGATERLMNALCALRLLGKTGNKFFNTPLSFRFLAKQSPEFMRSLMHTANMWHSWATLTQAVRKGKSVLATRPDKRGKEWLAAFIAAMDEFAMQRAKKVISLLELSGVRNVLDVGGGSGAYAAAFMRAKKEIKATVFDLRQVMRLTNEYIRKQGLLGRIKIVAGDYNVDNLGRGFDLVFLSAIVHSNSASENRILINKCANALNPGGQLVIQDFIMDEDKTAPEFGAIFSLNMLVATDSGDTYIESEVRAWLKNAGLSKIKRRDTGFGTSLIIGKRVR